MRNMSTLHRRKVILLGLLAIVIVFIGYLSYIGIANMTKSSNQSPTTKPVTEQLFPPAYPNNPSNYSLVSNYSITIPEIYNGGDIPKYYVSMKFIAPLSSLQSEENWTITNCTVDKLPFPFTTWASNTSTSYDPNSIAKILPAVFNGTTIDVKVDVYGYNGVDVQQVASKEWNVTEYVFT